MHRLCHWPMRRLAIAPKTTLCADALFCSFASFTLRHVCQHPLSLHFYAVERACCTDTHTHIEDAHHAESESTPRVYYCPLAHRTKVLPITTTNCNSAAMTHRFTSPATSSPSSPSLHASSSSNEGMLTGTNDFLLNN